MGHRQGGAQAGWGTGRVRHRQGGAQAGWGTGRVRDRQDEAQDITHVERA